MSALQKDGSAVSAALPLSIRTDQPVRIFARGNSSYFLSENKVEELPALPTCNAGKLSRLFSENK